MDLPTDSAHDGGDSLDDAVVVDAPGQPLLQGPPDELVVPAPPPPAPYEILVVEEPGEAPGTPVGAIVWAAVASAVLASLLTVGALSLFGAFDNDTVVAHSHPPPADTSNGQTTVGAVAMTAAPSIVTIQTVDQLAEDLPIGSGSGVVFRSDGFIVTNDHVIAGATDLRVVFADGLTYPATVVGSDSLTDIAVIRVDASDLPVVTFASQGATVGDIAVAVGNPLGLNGGPSVTSGVVSALDRTLPTNGLSGAGQLYGLLQTDAPITRGSSGGALLNDRGELIGITTAIGVSDVGAEGLGFAVPSHLVERIASDLISDGNVRHAFLGISGRPAFAQRSDGANVPVGAEISELLTNSAIGAAGAQVGDVIVAVDGERVNSLILLVARLRTLRAGDEVIVTVSRDGAEMDLTLVLDLHPESST